MCITVKEKWQDKLLAEPVGWENLQAEEQRFLDAEEDRLLYVATTRAANMLVVSVGGSTSAWSALEPFLDEAPVLAIPTDEQLQSDAPLRSQAVTSAAMAITRATDVWQPMQLPSYSIVSVKKESLKGSRRPDWQGEGEYGMLWGTAVHELLDMASHSSDIHWQAQALAIATENGVPASRVDELVETVQAVIASDIWKRSRAATRCYSELPFDVPGERDGQPAIIRGVIDLIFEEPDGWVIVDYKSDNINVDDIDSLSEFYRPQLAEYAHYWRSLTGFKVKEQGLYLTRLKRYVT